MWWNGYRHCQFTKFGSPTLRCHPRGGCPTGPDTRTVSVTEQRIRTKFLKSLLQWKSALTPEKNESRGTRQKLLPVMNNKIVRLRDAERRISFHDKMRRGRRLRMGTIWTTALSTTSLTLTWHCRQSGHFHSIHSCILVLI